MISEAKHPVPGPGSPVAVARTDKFGWARVDVSKLPSSVEAQWLYVHADGYAPNAAFLSPGSEPEIRLRPPANARVRILDPLGAPLPGAHLGFLLGCGHCPDVASAVSNEAGEVVLRGVQPETLSV